MSELSLFDLIITGHHSTNSEDALARDILDLLDVHNPKLEQELSEAFQVNPCAVTVCERIELKAAMLWQKKLSAYTVSSELRPVLQSAGNVLELETYTCSVCGHEQPQVGEESAQVCKVCGVATESNNEAEGLQDLLQAEQQRRETEKTRVISDALKQAKYQEDRRLREEAQRGTKPPPAQFAQVLLGVVGTFTVAVGLGIAYFLTSSAKEKIDSLPQTATSAKQGAAGPAGKIDTVLKPAMSTQAKPKAETDLAATAPSEPPTKPTQPEMTQGSEATQLATLAPTQPTDPQQTLEKPNVSQTSAISGYQAPTIKLIQALESIEEIHQLQPQSGVASRTLGVDRERIQQLLKINEHQLIPQVIASVQKPYGQSLLLLEYAQGQLQQGQNQAMHQAIEEMRKVQAATRDIDQQVLISGVISQAYLLIADSAKAESSLQQAIDRAGDVPKRSFQAWLLAQLANEQALFGNHSTARKLVKLAEPLFNPTAEATATSIKPEQMISLYALMRDFDEAKKRLPSIADVNKRDLLTQWLSQFEMQTH